MAPSTSGRWTSERTPRTAMMANQSTMTGPNRPPTLARAVALDGEDAHEDHDRDRHDVGLEHRRGHVHALDGAQHRDGRRDHAVAVEQRRAEEPSRISHRGVRLAALPRGGSSAVRARMPPSPRLSARSTTRDVLHRDDQQQRIDDEREHAEHVVVRRRHRVRSEEALAHRVERAGADVAVDDTDGGERERQQLARRAVGRQMGLQCADEVS